MSFENKMKFKIVNLLFLRKFCGFNCKHDRGRKQGKRNDFDCKVYAKPRKHVFDGDNRVLRNRSAVEKYQRKDCRKQRVGADAQCGGQGEYKLIRENVF